jgi:TrmH family RNA methyltransferase
LDEIRSKENPLIKEFVKLSSSNRFRRETGRFLLEGARIAGDAVQNGFHPITALVTAEALEKYPQTQKILQASERCAVIPKAVADKISGTTTSQGIFCIFPTPDLDFKIQKDGIYLALCSLQDPGNVGTIVRTAEAFGISGLIITRDCPDFFSPKVLRAGMGSILRMPVKIVENGIQAVELLKKEGIRTYAAALTESAVDITKVTLGMGSCVVIGNEGNGLPQDVIHSCDNTVVIPMAGRAQSLNAAVAAAVCIWETTRKR